ncbi:MAG: hypothetical protein A2687_04620 [Candidatus Levybacteria bacterium RIFCSPHIGHO2_01_FULL_38_26]|nr:MAG: hypothetical protein A2687_04620 [Candidatus Levybacteria bacterium RIFCSPHIGHO2_01_FULL_38_26]
MYYSHPCSYCKKIFYTYQNNRETAARVLFNGIKAHLIHYNEDHKEFMFDEHPTIEVNQMYQAMRESKDQPSGHYKL